MKKIYIATVLVMVMYFGLLSICVTAVKAFAETKISKVVFFVNSQEEYNSISDWQNSGTETGGNLSNSNLFDIRFINEINTTNLLSYIAYIAVALPFETEFDKIIIQNAFQNNIYVYLYGALTIKNFKDTVGLRDYSLNVNANGSDEDCVVIQTKQYFDAEYEENEVFNVIGYSNKALLCKISAESISSYSYLIWKPRHYLLHFKCKRGRVV